jgi:hypothetical protein
MARPTEEAEQMFNAASALFNAAIGPLPVSSTDPIVNALKKQMAAEGFLAMGLAKLAIAIRQIYDKS